MRDSRFAQVARTGVVAAACLGLSACSPTDTVKDQKRAEFRLAEANCYGGELAACGHLA
ncbi:MAG: hypothetical protein FJ100_10295, partial [Deltaproteobacteria bacterium]|nr:hypothetical protein [Deltaproteobacteria bacterium]